MKFPAIVITLLAVASCVFGQTAALNGRVTDESGAVVPAAKVTINRPGIPARTAVTGADGTFTLKGLPAGDYTLEAWTATYGVQEQKVSVRPGESTTVYFDFKGN